MRLWKTARHEASWDVVGSTYSLCWSAEFAVPPDPRTSVIEGRSSVMRKAAKSPVVAGSVTVFAMVPAPLLWLGYPHSIEVAVFFVRAEQISRRTYGRVAPVLV